MKVIRTRVMRSVALAVFVAGAACTGQDFSTGEGATDIASGQVVELVDFGHVSFSQIDIPDVIKASYPQSRTLTVTNKTSENWGPVGIRFALSKRCVGEVNGYLNHIDKDFVGCTNTCATANNGVCDDAWPGPHDGACQPGTDCADCGVRGADWACTGDSNLCQANEYCEPQSKMCNPELISVSSAIIRGLNAGESKVVQYELALPLGWTSEDEFSFVILFDEEPLKLDGDQVIRDPDVPQPLPGMTPFHLASAVYVHQSEVRTEVDPPNFDADISVATSMIELDDTMFATRPALVANMSLTSLGMPAFAPTYVKWKLKLPGHQIDRKTYDAAAPDATYDPERTFELKAGVGNGKVANDLLLPFAGKPAVPQGVYVDRSSGNKAREGTTVDRSYALHLHLTDVASLGETLKLRSKNPDLNGSDEIVGALVTEVSTFYEGENIVKTFETPVVFKAPEVAFEADGVTPKVARPLDLTLPPDAVSNPYPEVLDEYPEVDNITPTWYKSYGGPWLGAEAQVRNFTSKGRYQDAVVRQNLIADNFLRVFLFNFRDGNGNPQPFPLLEIAAHIDQGTLGRDSIQENVGNAMVRVPATSSDLLPGLAAVATGQGSIFDLLSNTLLDVDMADAECDFDAEGVEVCDLMSKGDDEPPDYLPDGGDDGYEEEPDEDVDEKKENGEEDPEGWQTEDSSDFAVNIEPGKISIEYTREKKKSICKPIPEVGPFCLEGKLSASAALGIRGTISLFRQEYPLYDPLEQPEVFQGLQVSVGPFIEVGASASGTASLIIAGVSITGNVTFVEAELVPTLRLGLAQELKTQGVPEDCWRKNTGRVAFLGPASLKVMFGDVELEAWAGLYISTIFGDIDLRTKVFSFTLYEFPPLVERNWTLWNESVDFRKEGLCPGLDTAGLRYATPVGCKSVTGEDAYCPKGPGGDGWDIRANYSKRLYTGPSQCGRIVIEGSLEPYGFDEKLGATIGDYVQIETGPTGNADGTSPFKNDEVWCARYSKVYRHFENNGTSVICDAFDKPASLDWTHPNHWRYSGEFNNFTLDFCKDSPNEYFRWVNVQLRSDSMLSTKGLAVRLEPLEGPESTIYSKEGWESSNRLEPWHGHVETLDFAHVGDYFGAKRIGDLFRMPYTLPREPYFARDEGYAVDWIWPQNVSGQGLRSDFARFRRPFLATSDEYYVAAYCGPMLECKAFISPSDQGGTAAAQQLYAGNQRVFQYDRNGTLLSRSPGGTTVRTRRGEPHLLYIEARYATDANKYLFSIWGQQDTTPWYGVAVMMKPVEE